MTCWAPTPCFSLSFVLLASSFPSILLYHAVAFCRLERDWGSLQLLDLRWVMCQGREGSMKSRERRGAHPGFTKPAGTGPVTGLTGPVLIPAGFKPVQIQILNLNSKKWKNPKKNLKNTSSCDEFNDVKFFQIFVHLIYFAGI